MIVKTGDMEEKTFEKKRLTKKGLTVFLDEYAATLFKVFEGTDEEKLAGFTAEWAETNERMKKEGAKKKQRANRRGVLKVKWGMKLGYRGRRTEDRLRLIQHIKTTFSL